MYITPFPCVVFFACSVFVPSAKALAEFDVAMSSLSRWCDQWAEPASHLPAVGAIVSVKEAESGVWRRAKVLGQASERCVEQ